MNSLYLLCFVGLISSVFSLATNVQEKESYNFDYHNISVVIGTDWESLLAITNVSTVNDPNEKLILYYNVSQSFDLPENQTRILNLEVLKNTDIYKKEADTFYKEVRDIWYIEDGNVELGISLGSYEKIVRNVDFSDFSKRSYIDYVVVFSTELNITYDYENSIEQVLQKYPELTKIQMPLLENVASGLIPLANGTGSDDTSCKYRICKTSTNPSKNMDTYYLFDNVTVTNSLEIDGSSRAYVENNVDGKSVYSAILIINLKYQVVIGEHRC